MSTYGGGEVLIIPAAILGAAAVAALVAAGAVLFVGGVVVVQAGKGLVACGKAIDDAVRAHAAQQRAIYAQCEAYERMMLERAVQAGREALARQAAERAAAARSRIAAIPPQAPALPEFAAALPVERADELRVYTRRDLGKWQKSLQAELAQVKATLDEFDKPAWAGLIVTAPLRERLDAVSAALQPAAGEQASLAKAQNQLRSLRYEVATAGAGARERAAARQTATEALVRAWEVYERRAAQLEGNGELSGALAVAEDLLGRAEARISDADPTAAARLAETATRYMEQLGGSLDAARRRNFEVAISALRKHVADYQFATDDPAPRETLRLADEAAAALARNDFVGAGTALRDAQTAAQKLDQLVVRETHSRQQQGVVKMASEVLAEMGFKPGAALPQADRSLHLMARRKDGATFHVIVSAHGLMRFKTEDFQGRQCEKETDEFYRRLRERGMAIDMQSLPALEEAAARVREAIHRSGALGIEQRIDPDGKGITLSATYPAGHTGPAATYHVDFSGRVKQEGGAPAAVDQTVDAGQSWAQEWDRQWREAEAQRERVPV